MNETRRTKKKKRRINKILTIILLVTVLIFFGLIFYINIIPILYSLIALVLVMALVLGIVLLNFRKKKIIRIIGYTSSIILSSLLIFIEIYLFNTVGFLFNMTDGNYALKNYNVIVLNTSEYSKIKELKNKDMGISETSKSEELDEAKSKISKKVKVNYEEYEDLNGLVDSLIENEVDSIILEDSEMSLIEEQNKEHYDLFKTIYEVEIKNNIEDLKSAININKEPFNIYISGIDTFGSINASSRSDVNMVVTVNPKSEKLHITWVPRDYYVNINDSIYKDKLTHAGIYGIDSSIYALENLLDIDINYYVKVNFTSVIEVVDLLGGIEVYNDESFTSQDGFYYKKGNIKLNGEKTLSFVRERKNVTGGDLGRGKNQIKVLEALIEKATSPSIIVKYNSLLKSLDGAFITNMNQNTMISFIREEISNTRNWNMTSNTLVGTDSLEYTYSYRNTALYVMKPNDESVNAAKNKIQEVMEK